MEQNNTAENIIEEIMEESDESPPYLPAPSAPSPSQDFVEKSVWFQVQEKDFQHKFLPKKSLNQQKNVRQVLVPRSILCAIFSLCLKACRIDLK